MILCSVQGKKMENAGKEEIGGEDSWTEDRYTFSFPVIC